MLTLTLPDPTDLAAWPWWVYPVAWYFVAGGLTRTLWARGGFDDPRRHYPEEQRAKAREPAVWFWLISPVLVPLSLVSPLVHAAAWVLSCGVVPRPTRVSFVTLWKGLRDMP